MHALRFEFFRRKSNKSIYYEHKYNTTNINSEKTLVIDSEKLRLEEEINFKVNRYISGKDKDIFDYLHMIRKYIDKFPTQEFGYTKYLDVCLYLVEQYLEKFDNNEFISWEFVEFLIRIYVNNRKIQGFGQTRVFYDL